MMSWKGVGELMTDGQKASVAAPRQIAEVRAFAEDWYRQLDEHGPASNIAPLVLDQGLEYVVPEATLRSRKEFVDWYAGGNGHPGVINLYFDEVHTIVSMEAMPGSQYAQVKLVVNWQGRRWRAPAPRSQWFGFDSFQTWNLVRSRETTKLVLARYVVDKLQPMPGSPSL